MVRAENTGSVERNIGGVATAPATKPATIRRWVTFSFAPEPPGPDTHHPDEVGRYRLEVVQAIRGATPENLMPGCAVTRREQDSSRPPATPPGGLSGVTVTARSTPEAAEAGLLRSWSSSPWRVALVLAFSHAASFWALPAEQRGATYLGLHEIPREPRGRIMGRLLRRLYRSRNIGESAWDYLAYFEMQPADVAHVREHLAEVRDRRSNALFNHVNRELELWMTKQLPPLPTGAAKV